MRKNRRYKRIYRIVKKMINSERNALFKMNKDLEIRIGSLQPAPEGRTIEGVAITANSPSQLLYGEFREVISPDALTQEFINSQDIRVLYDHIPERGSLARSKHGNGTLALTVADNKLNFKFEAPNTPFGNEILDGVRRGDIDKLSFAFRCGDDMWEEQEDGTYLRTVLRFDSITEISLLDVAPAYESTSVATRSLEKFKEEHMKDNEQREAGDASTKIEDPVTDKPVEDTSIDTSTNEPQDASTDERAEDASADASTSTEDNERALNENYYSSLIADIRSWK